MQSKNVQKMSSNENKNLKTKDFLTTLEKLKSIPDYENLGFTITSLCNIAQTALLAETECRSLTLCHKPLDLFNIFNLIKILIPEDEWEFLDKINS